MKMEASTEELRLVELVLSDLTSARLEAGIRHLQELKDHVYAAIPARQRISHGITWVVQRISDSLGDRCSAPEQIKEFALALYQLIEKTELLVGVPIFMMARYGVSQPLEVFPFFAEASSLGDWVVREFAAGAFHPIIAAHKHAILPWLCGMAQSQNPYQRRFASETLRPVTCNRWLNQEPEYSLSVLRLMFRESHPYPRTSVGNNLSDLSRRNPELIFNIVLELVGNGDKNSYWIAYRACRNLVKKHPQRVLDVLGVDEYHYKDRYVNRGDITSLGQFQSGRS